MTNIRWIYKIEIQSEGSANILMRLQGKAEAFKPKLDNHQKNIQFIQIKMLVLIENTIKQLFKLGPPCVIINPKVELIFYNIEFRNSGDKWIALPKDMKGDI